LHFTSPNAYIDLAGTPFRIPTTLTPWPSPAPHFAGISAFGFGGTNAHVVVESGRASSSPVTERVSANLFVLSARTATALQALTSRCREALAKGAFASLHDICSSLQVGRAQLEHRLAVCVDSMNALRRRLEEPDQSSRGWLTGSVRRGRRPKIAYLFGETSRGTGLDALYEQHPHFRALAERAAGQPSPGVAEWVSAYALVTLLGEWGIEPALILGEGRAASLASALPARDGATPGGRRPKVLSFIDREPTGGSGLIERVQQEGIDVVIEFGDAPPSSEPQGEADQPCWLFVPLNHPLVWESLLDVVGRLFVNGAAIDWTGFTRERPFRRLALPTYPFERRRFWVQPYRVNVDNLPARADAAGVRQEP
jgi:acyl transferase domain-containing protein